MKKAIDIFKKIIKNKIFVTAVIALLIIGIAITCVARIDSWKYSVSNYFNKMLPQVFPQYIIYQNNVLCEDYSQLDFENGDVREIRVFKGRSKLINHSRGFSLEFPEEAQYDFTAAQEHINVKCNNFTAVVSKEFSTNGNGVENSKLYVKNCINKYLLDEKYLAENNITVHENKEDNRAGYPVQVIALTRTPAKGSAVKYNTYVYCYIYTETNMFYRIMFRSEQYNDELMSEVYKTLDSLDTDISVRGVSSTFTDYRPVVPQYWSEETMAMYNDIVSANECRWGIYSPHAIENNDLSDIEKLEEKAESEFDGVLEYTYLFTEIPVEGMKSAYRQGKVVELTLQTSTEMNRDLNGKNPVFDVIDGLYDEKIRKMAADIKEVGHPVLFRLNNEMNSDWTSYSGAACMTDPEIYIMVWKRIYDIFEEEGVNNTIWIFNPNDESFPPNGYNASMAYYPGDEYVHMFGITGYNTGTYYAELNGERWRTFDEIYSAIDEKYSGIYGEFPWIITEFASSSIGGDKVKWIKDMFKDIKKYPRIKMAFWFNSADFESISENYERVARPYWFDETEETAKAFAEGLK